MFKIGQEHIFGSRRDEWFEKEGPKCQFCYKIAGFLITSFQEVVRERRNERPKEDSKWN